MLSKRGHHVPEPSTVFVVDDDPGIQDSLRMMIEGEGYNVELFPNAEEFLDRFDPEKSGCLLLDIRMPGIGGLELQRRLAERNYRIPTIILTGHADIQLAVAAMKAGAFDLLEKPYSAERLLPAIQAALGRDVLIREHRTEQAVIAKDYERLTPRERTVLDLIVEGEPTKRIAAHLGTSFNTVRNQRSSILRKMNADSVVDLVRKVSTLKEPELAPRDS